MPHVHGDECLVGVAEARAVCRRETERRSTSLSGRRCGTLADRLVHSDELACTLRRRTEGGGCPHALQHLRAHSLDVRVRAQRDIRGAVLSAAAQAHSGGHSTEMPGVIRSSAHTLACIIAMRMLSGRCLWLPRHRPPADRNCAHIHRDLRTGRSAPRQHGRRPHACGTV